MRTLLRYLFLLTLLALAGVIAALLFGDRAFKRTSPAVRLVYEVHTPGGGAVPPLSEMVEALKKRLDAQEMHEIDVHPQAGGQRIEIVAPATVPKADLKRVLQMGGVLSFHILVESRDDPGAADMLARVQNGGAGPQPQPGDKLQWLPYAQSGAAPVEASVGRVNYVLVHATPDKSMTHEDPSRRWSVVSAQPAAQQGGGTAVAFELDRRGAKLFGELTGNNIGRMLAIALDGKILSAPRVNSRIGAHGMISGGPGGFTRQETDYLVSTLNAGTLPAKIGSEPVSEDYLTMTLGLSPATRRMLRISAIALAILAGLLWCARLLHRRLYPTVADQQAALRSLGMFEEP